jgi:hypothetical protein
MAGLQRRQAITVVFLRIVVVADPDEGGLKQVNDGGKDLLTLASVNLRTSIGSRSKGEEGLRLVSAASEAKAEEEWGKYGTSVSA